MKNFAKRGLALIMALVMCVSLLPGIGVSVSAASYIYNWGQRGEVATELSDNARAFYEDYDVTYDELAALSGSSSISGVPSSALYKKLQSLMTDAQHTVTSYADTRTMFQYTDCQNGGGTISSFYSGKEIGPAWDGGSTWNREHTWPNSKGDASGDGENDIMMLRPTSVSENSSRGNKAYGESSGYYFPNGTSGGTYDLRGDVSRIMLFVYVRWGNTVNMWGESGVIESKEVLLNWMEEDPVDTWELGRNDAVESITGTRNVFVDYPELAFELFDADVPAEMVTPSASDRAKDYTVTATSSNESYGTVSVEGHTITATVVKNGYTVGGYKVTSGIADVERSGNVFTVYPKSNCTVQITFRKLQEMTMTFTDAAGNAAAEEICELEGTAVILPDYAGAAYTTHAFVGWVENAVTDTANEPTSLKAGGEYILTNDTQLLALYSYTTGGVTYYTTSVGCVHENTSRTGAKDATCIAAGYTGDTVCTDCGQTLQTGETIAMTGHNYVDGTCSSCGGAEPLDYVLVTDVGQLSAGASVVIVAAEADYALSTNQKSNNRGATAITKSGDILEITDDVAELTLEAGSQPDTWAFYTGSGYLYAASSSSNHLKTQSSLNNNGCWIITIADGVASVVAQGNNTRATMQYNPNNGAPLFSCYTGATQGALALYVKGGAASGCDHSVTTVTGAKDATCTAPGYTGDTVCTACGETVAEGAEIPAADHTEAVDAAVAPTCTDTGLTEGTHCSACNEVLVAQSVVDALGHTEVTENAAVPTCAKEGYTGDVICSACGQTLQTGESIPVTDHSYVGGVCSACGAAQPFDAETFAAVVPVLTAESEPVSGGGILSWEAVEGASYYRVYRASSKSGSYKILATVEKTQLTVSVSAGSSRYYKIKAVYDDGEATVTTKYSNYVKVTGVCAQPEVEEVYAKASNGKPYLDWDKVSGAKKYYVYRVDEDGTMTRLTSTTKTSYTHTKAKVGQTYTYVVRAIASSSSRNSIYSQPVTCTAKLSRPVLKISLLSSTGKPELDWKNVSGAAGYEVWREAEDEDPILLATVTESIFVDESAIVDVEYEYEIVAVAEDPAANSAPSEDKEATAKCAKPVASAELVDQKPMITWGKVDGAVKYYVYRSTSKSGTYTKIGTAYKESYHDAKAKKNKTYYYKIVAVSEETKSSNSSYVKIKSK